MPASSFPSEFCSIIVPLASPLAAKSAFERAERKALALHQFGKNLGNALRLACRDRYVMDHLNASVAKVFQCRCFNRCRLS